MRSKPGRCQEEEHSEQRVQQPKFKEVLGCAGSRVIRADERERYTEKMRRARQLGQGLMGMEDHSKDLSFILSEMRATEPQSFGQVGGSSPRWLPFLLTQSTSATSLGLHLYTAPHPNPWLQSEDEASCLSRPLISWCHLL